MGQAGWIHKDVFPDLYVSQTVTAMFPALPCRAGKSEVDGSAPPFLPPVSGTAALRKSHLGSTPWGVRSCPINPWREGLKSHV